MRNKKVHPMQNIRKREPLIGYLADSVGSILTGIQNQDQYGTPINLYFDKNKMHKSLSGGCLSLLFKYIVLGYFILGFTNYFYMKDWTLVSHE